ncbi:hypothetical protein SAMN06265379_101962 [Saccharicrinis carchari]|uniref:RHS repeat-associated core domain-containing protein n=1 Tax=Saccharicrinis carchari TaxID=1168039 RepID=A0A521BI67_SACCC|nr:hypothetical protein [Saccharicrinis carchari]SMO46837.1 hypothetical protein SAMN06265379_101962 [Saccharicrinis carchari]
MSRFLIPDPGTCPDERSDIGIQAPGLAMSHNRYAYCMNNPFMFTDPSGYKWDWNYLNPVHWLSEGMQWINDNTKGLRKKMVEIGVSDFGVGINSAGHTSHYVGDHYVNHNQFRASSPQAIWDRTTVTFKNGINQDGTYFTNNLGVSSDNVRVSYDNADSGGGWDTYTAPMDNTRIDPSYFARGGSSGVARISQGYRLVQFGIAPPGNFSPFAIDGHAKENLDIGNGSPLGIVDIIAGWTSRNIFKPYSNPQNWSDGDTIIQNWNYRLVPALTIMNINNMDTTFTPIYDGVTPPYWYMPPSNSDYKKRIK